jgi:hypothetical protein
MKENGIMKRYDDFEELCKDNNINLKYAENELNNFLGCEGSEIVEDIDIEPNYTFELESVSSDKFQIGVTSIKIDKPITIGHTIHLDYQEYYWI